MQKLMKFFSRRGFKYGTVSTILVVAVIIVAFSLNMVLEFMSTKVPMRFDMTSTKIYELDADNVDYLTKNVTSPVKIIVCKPEFSITATTQLDMIEMIKKYDTISDNINLSFIDIDKNPEIAKKYGQTQLSSSSIIVSTEDDRYYKILNFSDLLYYQTYTDSYGQSQQQLVGYQLEKKITSAISAVLSGEVQKIYWIKGHNEVGTTELPALFTMNNFEIEELSLELIDAIPEDVKYIVCVGPTEDFTDREIAMLDKFLEPENNGRFFLFLSHEMVDMPKLETLINIWGIDPQQNLIGDNQQNYSNDPSIMIPNYNSKIAVNCYNKGLLSIVPYSCSLNRLYESRGNYTTSQVLYTSSDASVISGEDDETLFPPYNIALLSENKKYASDLTANISYVFCVGSVGFIADSMLAEASIGNSTLLLDVLTYINPDSDSQFFSPKVYGNAALNMTANSAYVCIVLFAIVFPLSILIAGLVVFLRRRHL